MEREAKKAAAEAEEKKGNLLAGFTTELSKDEQLDLLREQLPQFTPPPPPPETQVTAASSTQYRRITQPTSQWRQPTRGTRRRSWPRSRAALMGQAASRALTTSRRRWCSDRALNVLVLPEHALKDPSESTICPRPWEVESDQGGGAVQDHAQPRRRLLLCAHPLGRSDAPLAGGQAGVRGAEDTECGSAVVGQRAPTGGTELWAQCERKRLALHANFQYCPPRPPTRHYGPQTVFPHQAGRQQVQHGAASQVPACSP